MPTAGSGEDLGARRPDGDLVERRRVDVPAEPPAAGQHAGGDGPVVRHEHLLQPHRLAAGRQQPGRVPVVDDLERALGHQREARLGRAVLLRHEDLEVEIVGEVDAAGKAPQPVEHARRRPPASRCRAGDREAGGDQRLRVVAPDVVLGLDAVHRQHQAVRHQVGEHPGARPAAAAELDGDVDDRPVLAFEPAIALRLEDPVEARVEEVAVGRIGHPAQFVRFLLAFEQHRHHRRRLLGQRFAKAQASIWGHGILLGFSNPFRRPAPTSPAPDRAVGVAGCAFRFRDSDRPRRGGLPLPSRPTSRPANSRATATRA